MRGVTLSRDVIRFFPTFTLHDGTHLAGVCKWMIRLLGDRKAELTAEEAAILLMSACCHDMGMSVSERGIHREVLIRICESHGKSLSDFRDLMPASNCNLNMCSVLLRLADALDYDAARAPESLFRQLGLDHPETEEKPV